MGIDTVQLNGEGFSPRVTVNQKSRPVTRWSTSTSTSSPPPATRRSAPIVITNAKKLGAGTALAGRAVLAGDPLLLVDIPCRDLATAATAATS